MGDFGHGDVDTGIILLVISFLRNLNIDGLDIGAAYRHSAMIRKMMQKIRRWSHQNLAQCLFALCPKLGVAFGFEKPLSIWVAPTFLSSELFDIAIVVKITISK